MPLITMPLLTFLTPIQGSRGGEPGGVTEAPSGAEAAAGA